MNAIEFHSSLANSFANNYTQKRNLIERLQLWNELIRQYVPQYGKVLDAGCGPGFITDLVLNQMKYTTVVGIDGSLEMLHYCTEKHTGNHRAIFRQLFIPSGLTNFPRNYFDTILSSSVLEYIEDSTNSVCCFAELLKPGGKLIISVPNADSWYRKIEKKVYTLTGEPSYLKYSRNHFVVSEIKALLEKEGLSIKQVFFDGHVPVFSSLFKLILRERSLKTMIVIVAEKI